MFQHLKIFEMPLPGYLGFLPFALECFVMYVTAASMLKLLKRQPQETAFLLPEYAGKEINKMQDGSHSHTAP